MPNAEQPTITTTAQSNGARSNAGTLTAHKSQLERMQSGWEMALSIALAVTAIAALLLFLFDLGVRKSSKRIQAVQDEIIRAKDAELQSSLRAKDLRIAEIGREAAEAKERASANESGNLRLRADLEHAVAESDSKQTELEVEQRKTAEAQKEAAEAQLALKQHLDAVSERVRPREIDGTKFVSLLEGKPKARVELLYDPNDAEAYWFSQQLHAWLGSGMQGKRGCGWEVSIPSPIPAGAGYQEPEFQNRPPAMRFGGAGSTLGITFLVKDLRKQNSYNPETPLTALSQAIGFSVTSLVGNSFVSEEDRSLPDDTIRIVVGPRVIWAPPVRLK